MWLIFILIWNFVLFTLITISSCALPIDTNHNSNHKQGSSLGNVSPEGSGDANEILSDDEDFFPTSGTLNPDRSSFADFSGDGSLDDRDDEDEDEEDEDENDEEDDSSDPSLSNSNTHIVTNPHLDDTSTSISILGRKQDTTTARDTRPVSFFAQPSLLAAVIGGIVVSLLCAILLTMFIIYRARKKDEGSYICEPSLTSPVISHYGKASNKFFDP